MYYLIKLEYYQRLATYLNDPGVLTQVPPFWQPWNVPEWIWHSLTSVAQLGPWQRERERLKTFFFHEKKANCNNTVWNSQPSFRDTNSGMSWVSSDTLLHSDRDCCCRTSSAPSGWEERRGHMRRVCVCVLQFEPLLHPTLLKRLTSSSADTLVSSEDVLKGWERKTEFLRHWQHTHYIHKSIVAIYRGRLTKMLSLSK